MVNVERPETDFAGEVRRAADDLADRLDTASYALADRLEAMSRELATHVDIFGEQLGEARGRLGKSLRRIEDAVTDLGKSTERPGSRVANAVEDFAGEVRRSVDRLKNPKPRSRFAFWR